MKSPNTGDFFITMSGLEAQQFDDQKGKYLIEESRRGGEETMTLNEQDRSSGTLRIDSLSGQSISWGQLPEDPAERARLDQLALDVAGPKGDVMGTLRRLVYQRGRARLGADWTLDLRKH